MSMPKFLILTFESVDVDTFMDYIKHLEDDHHMKISIKREGNKDLYTGEDPVGNKELYGIMYLEEDLEDE